MRQVGYLCGDGLIINVGDVMLLLQYDSVANRFVSATRFRGGIGDRCEEVEINVEEQYSVKYFPRVYYTIFKIEFNDKIGYLLERFDGTSGSDMFYACSDYKGCKKLIKELEEE